MEWISARWMLSMRRWGRRLIRWCWHCWLQCANAFDLSVLLSVKHQDIEIAKSPSLIFTELKFAKKKNKHWNDNILTLITMEVSTAVIILPTGADLYFSAHIHNYPPGDWVQTYNRPPCEPIWEKGANKVCSFAEREREAAQTWMKLQSWERWDTIPGIARHCQAFVRNVWPQLSSLRYRGPR